MLRFHHSRDCLPFLMVIMYGDSMEDKNCNLLTKPYYYINEAAKYWCNINKKIAYDDITNPCYKIRVQHIEFAINNGDLVHGRDGRKVDKDDHVALLRRTVSHKHLKEWITKEFPEEKPEFLYDAEIRSKLLDPTKSNEYISLKANHETALTEIKTLKDRLEYGISLYKGLELENNQLKQEAYKKTEIRNSEVTEHEREKLYKVIKSLTIALADTAPSTYKTTTGKINNSQVETTLQTKGLTVSEPRKIISEALKIDF